jgi:hypothetical protein
VVVRRNARGGRSAVEDFVSAVRCLYRRALADGLIRETDNPAAKVAKPRRLPGEQPQLPSGGGFPPGCCAESVESSGCLGRTGWPDLRFAMPQMPLDGDAG